MSIKPAVAQKNISTDSIRSVLHTLPDASRLTYLRSITEFDQVDKKVLDLYKQEAMRQNDKKHLENALYREAYYYYPDSLEGILQVKTELTPLLYESKQYRRLFQVEMWELRILTRTGKTEEALARMAELRELSAKLHYPKALELIDQELAYFYISKNMIKDAEQLYYNVLNRMKKREAALSEQLPVYINLLPCIEEKEEVRKMLNEADNMIKRLYKDGVKSVDNENPIYQYEIELEWHYASNLSGFNDHEGTLKHIKRYEELLEIHNMSHYYPNLYQLYLNYYSAIKDNENKLKYIDLIVDYCRERNIVYSLYSYLEIEAETLTEIGNYKKALAVKDEMIALKDTISNTKYHEGLADMRIRHEVDRLELENQRMEMNAKQINMRLWLLAIGCVLLILVVLGLANMVRVVNRSKQVLKTAKEKAEEADMMKSAFLANMNHEIRTPLNSIVGFSQVLIEEKDEKNRATFAEIIQHNNELLQRLIGDVLDISKIESNSMSLIYSEQDISVIMKEVYNMISIRMQPGVKLILDPCEPYVMETDRNRMVQIITNLLTNAMKHTSSGHIRFGYKLDNQNVTYYVEDTGEGIPHDQLVNIFDRFTQLKNGKKGVGLGLAICKGLVTKMNGKIWAVSTVGEGTTFFVKLPKTKHHIG